MKIISMQPPSLSPLFRDMKFPPCSFGEHACFDCKGQLFTATNAVSIVSPNVMTGPQAHFDFMTGFFIWQWIKTRNPG